MIVSTLQNEKFLNRFFFEFIFDTNNLSKNIYENFDFSDFLGIKSEISQYVRGLDQHHERDRAQNLPT